MSVISQISQKAYPYNLIYDIFQRDIYQEIDEPEDIEESVSLVISRLPEIEQKILFYRYSEHRKLREISELCGFGSRQAANNRIRSALSKLKQPSNVQYFLKGRAGVEGKRKARKPKAKSFAYKTVQKSELAKMTHKQLAKVSVDMLGLSPRAANALKRNGIETIGRLLELTQDDFIEFKGVRTKVAEEIEHCLEEAGFQKRIDVKGEKPHEVCRK